MNATFIIQSERLSSPYIFIRSWSLTFLIFINVFVLSFTHYLFCNVNFDWWAAYQRLLKGEFRAVPVEFKSHVCEVVTEQ